MVLRYIKMVVLERKRAYEANMHEGEEAALPEEHCDVSGSIEGTECEFILTPLLLCSLLLLSETGTS